MLKPALGAPQSISLGVHCISDAFPEAMLLIEVLPAPLASRDFPRLATAHMLEAGYRDSPHPSSVAIVFVMVSCYRTMHVPSQLTCPWSSNISSWKMPPASARNRRASSVPTSLSW